MCMARVGELRLSTHLPSLITAEVILMQRVVRIMFLGTIRILGHPLKRQRLDGVAGSGEERTVLAVTPGLEDEAALPAGGQWWEFFGVKLDSQFIAGAEDDKTIVAVAQQLGDFTVAGHFSGQSRYGHGLL